MKSEEIQAEIILKRHEIAALQAKLVEALSIETGIHVGGIVKKDGRKYQVTHLDGESAANMSVYGAPKKVNGEFARRDLWLGYPVDVEVVK